MKVESKKQHKQVRKTKFSLMAADLSTMPNSAEPTLHFADNRLEPVAQRKSQKKGPDYSIALHPPLQKKTPYNKGSANSRESEPSANQGTTHHKRQKEFSAYRPLVSKPEHKGTDPGLIQPLRVDAIKYIKSNRDTITKEQLSDTADYWDILLYLRKNDHRPALRNAWNKGQPEDGRYRISDSDLAAPSQEDVRDTQVISDILKLASTVAEEGERIQSAEAREKLLDIWEMKKDEHKRPTEQLFVNLWLSNKRTFETLLDKVDLDPSVAIVGTDKYHKKGMLLIEAIEEHIKKEGKIPLHMAAYLYNRGEEYTKELNIELIKKISKGNMNVKISHKRIAEHLKNGKIDKFRKETEMRNGSKENPDEFDTWDEVKMLLDMNYKWDDKQGLLTKET